VGPSRAPGSVVRERTRPRLRRQIRVRLERNLFALSANDVLPLLLLNLVDLSPSVPLDGHDVLLELLKGSLELDDPPVKAVFLSVEAIELTIKKADLTLVRDMLVLIQSLLEVDAVFLVLELSVLVIVDNRYGSATSQNRDIFSGSSNLCSSLTRVADLILVHSELQHIFMTKSRVYLNLVNFMKLGWDKVANFLTLLDFNLLVVFRGFPFEQLR